MVISHTGCLDEKSFSKSYLSSSRLSYVANDIMPVWRGESKEKRQNTGELPRRPLAFLLFIGDIGERGRQRDLRNVWIPDQVRDDREGRDDKLRLPRRFASRNDRRRGNTTVAYVLINLHTGE